MYFIKENLTPDGWSVWSCVFNPEFPLMFVQELKVDGPFKFSFTVTVIQTDTFKRMHAFKDVFMTFLDDKCWVNHEDSPGIALSVDVGIKNEVFLNTYCKRSLSVLKRIDGIWKMCEIETNHQVDINISDYVKTFHFDENRKIVNNEKCVMSGFIILPHPTDYKDSPIIVIPHGGPILMSNHEYWRHFHMLHLSKFCLYFSILKNVGIVNYRGSTGFTNSTLESQYGNCGRQDVDDVHFTLLEVCQNEQMSTETVYCCGISYGGFLSAHLVGQYPDFYKGGILQNPFTNFLEDVAEFYKMSPLYYADHIKCPVILFLGSEDKGVPMEEGLQIYRNMKCRNQDVTVFIYKDGHPLQTVEAETSMISEILKFISRISPPKT
ncbi:Acylamino-acid-releasing enzyme [Thelohanellus kitauei]|uniref:Acylamino-acid-releasing enzyme n=1 Tax=Thelohanellus kitauei TaxID=669202 RepID=A0A0C2MJR0_THEKT|nr:Acylamino-acid-releasing enzyme [Thelohanellus kitauei]